MIRTIDYSELDKSDIKDNYVLIDVRSPGEHKEATIPGAVNVPLFNDEERRIIGTVYTNESTEKAKKLGIEAVSRRLPQIYDNIMELKKEYNTLVFFCAKGGMRSTSIASLLLPLGVNAYKLSGGYKGYRSYINHKLPEAVHGVKFIVIYGNTGVGKTNILNTLSDMGCDVLDLEKCANHRGSLFGSVGLGGQNSQKLFESLVYETLKNRKGNTVFVEGESRKIGRVIIPEYLFVAMKTGIHIKVEADMDYRVKNILSDYTGGCNDEIIDALNQLRKYISNKAIDEYIREVKENRYEDVVKNLMIKYYDPMYESEVKDFKLILKNENTEETCRKILKWLEENENNSGEDKEIN